MYRGPTMSMASAIRATLAVAVLTSACAPAADANPPPEPSVTPTIAAPSEAPRPTPGSTPTATPTATPASATHVPPAAQRIVIRDIDGRRVLYDTYAGAPFVARGVNILRKEFIGGQVEDQLFGSAYDADWVDVELGRLASLGYNTVRVFIDLCRSDCMAGPEALNDSFLDHLTDFIGRARDHGMVVLPTSNDLPDVARYGNAVPCCEPFGGYRNSVYLTADGHAAAERYWRDVVGGLIERGAATDAVLGWQLANEQFMLSDVPPLSLRGGVVTTADGRSWDMADASQRRAMVESNLVVFVDRIAAALNELDPGGLVTIGFFPPNEPLEWRPGDTRLVLVDAVLRSSSLDFVDLHAYPGGTMTMADIAAAYGLDQVRLPIVMGEMGGFRRDFATPADAAEALAEWQVQSCEHGFQGWLLWLAAPTDDEVWTGTEGDAVIDRALSPAERPDPCIGNGWVRTNLALGKPVLASISLPDQAPQAAVDGNVGSQWGAGADAPQWLEIDLEAPADVASIELVVAQFPAGTTRHRVLVGPRRGQLQPAGVIEQRTNEGDVLVIQLDAPGGEGVRFVRVETLASPSWVAWREVRVFAR